MKYAKPNDELQQQLWELVYDLLPSDEAAELCQRVTSEPDVARAYARIKLESELIAVAARIDEAQLPLSPGEQPSQERHSTSRSVEPAPSKQSPSVPKLAQSLNWLVGLAAVGLIGFVGYSYWGLDAPATGDLRAVAWVEQPMRTIVTSPAVFHAEVTNPLSVRTMALDGSPVSTQVELRFFNADEDLVLSQSATTDDNGNWQAQLRGSELFQSARFEIMPQGSDPRQAVSSEFNVIQGEHLTYLGVDKPYYRPGETVLFRSLTLSRFNLSVDREVAVHFEMHDAAGQLVENSQVAGVTERGVGNGSFTIPADFQGGKYSYVARSPQEQFPEERRDFLVHQYELPEFNKRLLLERDSYGPGDEVIADFAAERSAGGLAAAVPLAIRAVVDGQRVAIPNEHATTDERGAHNIRFRLPQAIRRGQGMLEVTIGPPDRQETIAQNIAINLGQVDVEFYPEGGDLVAELSNRVYFHSHDPLGRPVYLEGTILDGAGTEVATLQTQHAGRGRFEFTPRAGQAYTLRIDKPIGAGNRPPVPEISQDAALVMQTGSSVFPSGAPVEVALYTVWPLGPIVVSASCRGAVVGLLRVEPNEFERLASGHYGCKLDMALAPEAAGVIRVTAFLDDSYPSPAVPLVERLIFRRPTGALHLTFENLADSYKAGESLELSLLTKDENGTAQPAVLGVAAVDDALLNLADDKSPLLSTYYYLTSEIENPQDLENANFYLSEREGAAVALDSLLGTKGWRRFAEVELDQFALADAYASQDSLAAESSGTSDSGQLRGMVAVNQEALPPVTFAGQSSQRTHAGLSKAVRRPSPKDRSMLGRIAAAGGAALLIVVAVMWARRWAGSRRLWIPTAVLSAASLVSGILLMDLSIARRTKVASLPANSIVLSESTGNRSRRSGAELAEFETEEETASAVETDAESRADQGLYRELQPTAPTQSPAAIEPKVDSTRGRTQPAKEAEELLARRFRSAAKQENLPAEPDARRATADDLEHQPAMPALDTDLRMKLQSFNRKPPARLSALGVAKGTLPRVEDLREDLREDTGGQFFVRRYAFVAPSRTEELSHSPETVYWDPLLITDADGRASIHFGLPAIGVYRLRVDAHLGGRLGSAEVKIHSQ